MKIHFHFDEHDFPPNERRKYAIVFLLLFFYFIRDNDLIFVAQHNVFIILNLFIVNGFFYGVTVVNLKIKNLIFIKRFIPYCKKIS